MRVLAAALKDPNDIWDPEEVVDAVDAQLDDGRPVPEHSFIYRQAVGTTDTYLGLDPLGKDPTSTSCEDLVLRVKLPEASTAGDIDVDLKSDWVIVRTSEQCAPFALLMILQAAQPAQAILCRAGPSNTSVECNVLSGLEISDCTCDCSRLSTYLPHKVDDEQSTAQWDRASRTLKIMLKIVREDPF
jgi:PIH1 CS-like domain